MTGANKISEQTIPEIKENLENYLKLMPQYYAMLFEQDKVIRETNANQYQTITQNGFVYFESRDITHFVIPTNILNKTVEPYEYDHKVIVFNTRTNLFDTVYSGRSHKCVEYVFRWQEAKYGYSLKKRSQALQWLTQTKQYFDWTGELLTEEENIESQNRIKEIIAQVKITTGYLDDDSIPEVKLDDVKNDALIRAEVRAARRAEFQRSNQEG